MVETTLSLPHTSARRSLARLLLGLLAASTHALATDIGGHVELRAGYDDNIDLKESGRETRSSFLSIVPAISLQTSIPGGVTLSGGYELDYTRYLAEGLDQRLFHHAWGEATTRLKPRLFASLAMTVDALESPQTRDDEGWGYSLTPGLTYHVSERLSARLEGSYARWRYDSLDFDAGRSIIRLRSHQVDDRYAGKLGLSYLISPGNAFSLAYRVAYNASNNDIDEYSTNAIEARLEAAAGDSTLIRLEYGVGKWNYIGWRAGRILKGKLRDDLQQHLRLGVVRVFSPFTELFFNLEGTFNDSNLAYESYIRRLVYGGVRFNW